METLRGFAAAAGGGEGAVVADGEVGGGGESGISVRGEEALECVLAAKQHISSKARAAADTTHESRWRLENWRRR